MKTLYSLFIILLFTINTQAQELENQWLKRIGSTPTMSMPFADVFSQGLAIDNNDFVYSIGEFRNTIDSDADITSFNLSSPASKSMFITKRDVDGVLIWAKQIGSDTSSVTARSITTDNNGDIIIVGEFSNTTDFDPGNGVQTATGNQIVFLLKLNENGGFVWLKTFEPFEGGTCTIKEVKTDDAGNVYALGQHVDKIDFDPGSEMYLLDAPIGLTYNAAYITKLDQDGDFVWAKHTEFIEGGSIVQIDPSDIAIANNGNILVCGYSTGSVDFDPSGGVVSMPVIATGMFIWELNSNGEYSWATIIYGTENQNFGRGIALSETGNIYITGNFRGTTDFDPSDADNSITSNNNSIDCFILKLDANHNYQWVKGWGSNVDDYGYDITIDQDEKIYSTGWFQQTADFNPSEQTFNLSTAGNHAMFLQNLASDGDFISATQISGPTTYYGFNIFSFKIDCDSENAIYLSGSFNQTMNFDGAQQILDAGNEYDAFLLKLDVVTIGVSETYKKDDFSIYPNPALEFINLQLKSIKSSNFTYEIKDISGKSIILTGKTTASTFSIPVNTLPSGIYIIQILTDDHDVICKSFIKQ